ncbi:MAG TPA: CRTAC1 family protein [Mucilaginibacter sp.]|nr:CRTAC1 family protein [Mucilaginibacter sp.]
MNKPRRIPQIITIILFIILLTGSALISRQDLLPGSSNSLQREDSSLSQYGFFLKPVNEEANIHFRHTPPTVDPKLKPIERQIASMGASVSIADFDNDGWNDIYFTNSRPGSHNALYRNLHNGKFEEVAEQVGLADLNRTGTGECMGAVWGDFDNDGYEDVLVYKWGKPELYHNDGGKKFTNVTEGSGLPGWVNANSAIWLDFDGDGMLDLLICGYYNEDIDLSHLKDTKIMPESFRYANNGGRKYLLKNMGNGKFKDVTVEYGINSTKWTLAAASADLNGDGYPDLILANDYNVDELYINDHGKRFIEKGRQAGIGYIPKSGMSVALSDIDDSGLLGFYTTNITEKGILIQGDNYWKPISTAGNDLKFANLAQLAGIENAGWAYGSQFGDLNNDGYPDLYVANGFISAKKGTSYWYDYSKVTGGNAAIIGDARNWPDMNGKSQSGYQVDKIWLNNSSGLFEDVSDKVCPYEDYDGRAVAMADLWNRGVLDVIVANQDNIPLVYKNEQHNNNHWIDFDLHGTISNASAIGARVVLEWNGKKQVQVVTAGMGFSAQNQHRLHFGLGKTAKVDRVIIYWPSGQRQELTSPPADQLHVIKENKAKV